MAVAVLRKASEDSTEPYQTIIDRRNERIIDTAGRLECCAYLSLSTFKSNRLHIKIGSKFRDMKMNVFGPIQHKTHGNGDGVVVVVVVMVSRYGHYGGGSVCESG